MAKRKLCRKIDCDFTTGDHVVSAIHPNALNLTDITAYIPMIHHQLLKTSPRCKHQRVDTVRHPRN
ncbi:hypothetical protein PROFUN_09620 [Planoprotostelium fungivorum]|uniref:Uncharacterized protein n=1 Tax=Planoprotostelium fungivorum TaxID=1890364 RepID=A0A2P6MNW1_9EUKA|nr:hypothetical protein PROFUN_09620 [Planoprotostelium fungivorum]